VPCIFCNGGDRKNFKFFPVCGVRLARSLVFCVVCYTSLFALLSYFLWQWYLLSVMDLRFLNTTLVSSSFSSAIQWREQVSSSTSTNYWLPNYSTLPRNMHPHLHYSSMLDSKKTITVFPTYDIWLEPAATVHSFWIPLWYLQVFLQLFNDGNKLVLLLLPTTDCLKQSWRFYLRLHIAIEKGYDYW
jgi:hypothetical protein